jgi:large subunit ribosomal protein L22
MEAKAIAKYMRISPRKMKFVCDMVRGKHVDEALAILKFHPGKGAKILEKVVKSAVANAENNFDMDRDKLYISNLKLLCFLYDLAFSRLRF